MQPFIATDCIKVKWNRIWKATNSKGWDNSTSQVSMSVTFNPARLPCCPWPAACRGQGLWLLRRPLFPVSTRLYPFCFMPVKPIWIVLPSEPRAHTIPIEKGEVRGSPLRPPRWGSFMNGVELVSHSPPWFKSCCPAQGHTSGSG